MKLKQLCGDNMSLNDCELEVIRHAVDNIQENQEREIVNNPDVKKMIKMLESFLIKKKLVCYGGTAINNLLPKKAQFYDYNIEIPDYDFFSPNPVKHAKELANLYFSAGFDEVEAKAGVHYGTYKVFVNFIPIADITFQPKKLFKKIQSNAIKVDGILYANPNLLRMSMYLELSRPKGDVSRWEKIAKRLQLLNKHRLLLPSNVKCDKIKVYKELLPNISSLEFKSPQHKQATIESINNQRQLFVDFIKFSISKNCVFFGGFANKLYSNYTITDRQIELLEIPDFDILHEKPAEFIQEFKKYIKDKQQKLSVVKHKKVGEIIAEHYELKINDNTFAYVFKPLACHSYNTIKLTLKEYGKLNINIASIDTMLSFYLAFIYSDNKHYDEKRILCMCNVLFNIQKKNRFSQKKILRRFGETCYGVQETKTTIRQEKSEMFSKLKNKRNSGKYEEWFLNYKPYDFPLHIQSKIRSNPTYVMSIKQYNMIKKENNKRNNVDKSHEAVEELEQDEKNMQSISPQSKKISLKNILNIFKKNVSKKRDKVSKKTRKINKSKKSLNSIIKKSQTKKHMKRVHFNI